VYIDQRIVGLSLASKENGIRTIDRLEIGSRI
jgi:hypothetical protein